MTLRLRVAFEVDFDSIETAKAYGVALGFALGDAGRNALDIAETPAPRIERCRVEITETRPGHRHG